MIRLLAVGFLGVCVFPSCVTPSYARRCPHQHEHSCDIWYHIERRSECRRDPDSRECAYYERKVEERTADREAEDRE